MKLTKLSFVLILLFTNFWSLISQENKNYLKLAYGNFTIDQFINYKSRILPNDYTRSNITSKGAVFIIFNTYVSEKITSSGSFGFEKINSSVMLENEEAGKMNRNLFTLALETDFFYIKNQNFTMYANVGWGYSLCKDEYRLNSGEKDSGFTGIMVFQVNPIGLRLGNKLAFYTELGLGYKGIVNFGLSIRL